MELNWPEANLGEIVEIDCPCGNLSALGLGSINRRASRQCGGSFSEGALWEDPVDLACNFSSITRRLCEVASVSEILVITICVK